MEFQAVLDAVRSLPVDDQVRLVDQIHEELEALANDLNMTPEQIKEIERRIAAYDADPSIGIPWEEVEAHIDKQLEELGE
jgi:putative addiction module component (TIGR02574 family)